jgi:uncharacterized protein YcbX
MSGRVDG